MAHAVVGAGQHSLCREVAEAERILCLTGTVDYDGQIGGVGHIAEKMQSLDNELGQWRAGQTEALVVVPMGEDRDRLAAREATPGMAVRGADGVSKLCRELDISLGPAIIAASDTLPVNKAETPRRGGMWKWSLPALVFLAAAVVVFSPEIPRPPEQAPRRPRPNGRLPPRSPSRQRAPCPRRPQERPPRNRPWPIRRQNKNPRSRQCRPRSRSRRRVWVFWSATHPRDNLVPPSISEKSRRN